MPTTIPIGSSLPLPGRRAMVLRAFLAFNIIIGCAFGGVGVALVSIRERYGIDAATASLCISAVMLAGGLSAPFAAKLMERFGIRVTMIGGAVLSATGYLALAFAPSIEFVLAIYALFIGVGVTTCGAFPAILLANTWFQPKPGTAVGFVSMAVGVAIVPIAMEGVIANFGLRGFYLIFAVAAALVIPIVWGVAEAPEQGRAGAAADPHVPGDARAGPRLFGSGVFWTLVLSVGTLVGVSLSGLAHIFAFATERGQSAREAALLVSVLGGSSTIGAFSSGLLCDRIGGLRALTVVGIGFVIGWSILLLTTATAPMLGAVILIGICNGGVYPSFSVLAGGLFGRAALARVLGLYGFLALPMTFLMPPIAGATRDATGSYQLMIVSFIVIGGLSAATFSILSRILGRQQPGCANEPPAS